jgi:hypothetical protein
LLGKYIPAKNEDDDFKHRSNKLKKYFAKLTTEQLANFKENDLIRSFVE